MSHDTNRPNSDQRKRAMPRGQVLVIFAFLLTILIGFAAFVVDIAWIWSHQLQVQRAADAGALAGVVHLPQQPTAARTAAQAESRKNGYENGEDGVVVAANQDPNFGRRMVVTVSAPVETFFMRIFGFDEVTVSRTSRAEYILPVPMGSPQNYYGVGRFVDEVLGPTVADAWEAPANVGLPRGWTGDGAPRVDSSDDVYAEKDTTTNAFTAWRDFDISIPADQAIMGIEVELELRASSAGCEVGVEVSRDAQDPGAWTSSGLSVTPPVGPNPSSDGIETVGGPAELWGRTWTDDEVEDWGFGVRVEYIDNGGCGTVSIDRIRVRIHYADPTPQEVPVRDPYNTVDLVPQKFWGAMQSQGAPSIQGDAFMTKYASRTSTLNSTYCPTYGYCANDPEGYYNYAIEVPSGGGEIWIFDPGFCDVGSTRGTGENWTIGGSNGASPSQPVSAFYRLYNTNNTPWDFGDDNRVDTQPDGSYRRGAGNNGAKYWDPDLRNGSAPSGSGYTDCTSETWHNEWWQIASGLPGGTYRLHTTSHDDVSPSDQDNTTALNAFAIWARGAGGIGDVRVYGLGAMEAYFPLPGNQVSTFYLAQIEAIHAGKWVDISLWDPGDTGSLTADLSIQLPTASGYTAASFYSNSIAGTSLPESFSCGPETSSSQTSIRTSSGSGGIYNGYWVRVCVQIPDDYTAPTPPGETEAGWWKISYDMSGSGNSTDLTTWKVDIRGNPVHLIIPEDDTPTP